MLVITTGSIQETAAGQIPLPRLSSHRQAQDALANSSTYNYTDEGVSRSAEAIGREALGHEAVPDRPGLDLPQGNKDGAGQDFDEISELDIDSLAAFRQPGMHLASSSLLCFLPALHCNMSLAQSKAGSLVNTCSML